MQFAGSEANRSFASLSMTKQFGCKRNGRRCPLPPPAKSNRAALDDRVKDPLPPKFIDYAALLGPLLSRVFSLPTLTLICLGFASAFLGRLIFSTPLS